MQLNTRSQSRHRAHAMPGVSQRAALCAALQSAHGPLPDTAGVRRAVSAYVMALRDAECGPDVAVRTVKETCEQVLHRADGRRTPATVLDAVPAWCMEAYFGAH